MSKAERWGMTEKRVTVQKVGAVLKKACFTRAGWRWNEEKQEGYMVSTLASSSLKGTVRVEFYARGISVVDPRHDDMMGQYQIALEGAGLATERDAKYHKPSLLVTGFKEAEKGEGGESELPSY